MDEALHGIFLGFDGALELPGPALEAAIASPRGVVESRWVPNASLPLGGSYANRTTSLWNLCRTFTTKARLLSHSLDVSDAISAADFAKTDVVAEEHYVHANGPAQLFAALSSVLLLERNELLGVVAQAVSAQLLTTVALAGSFLAALVYFRALLDSVARARIQLLMVFLILPRPAVVKLATKSTKLQIAGDADHGHGDEDEDEEWGADRAQEEEKMARGRSATHTAAIPGTGLLTVLHCWRTPAPSWIFRELKSASFPVSPSARRALVAWWALMATRALSSAWILRVGAAAKSSSVGAWMATAWRSSPSTLKNLSNAAGASTTSARSPWA